MAAKRVLPRKFKRQLLTVKNVAQILGVSESLVYAWCENEPPEIEHVRLGRPGRAGAIRVPPDAITRYMKKKMTGDFDEVAWTDAIRAELED